MDLKILERLLDISRKMAENRGLDPLLEYAMGVALELVGAGRGYLVLQDEDGNLDFRVKLNHRGERLEQPEEQISHSILSEVVQKREAVVIADAFGDPNYQNKESIAILKLRSVMCVPLIARGDLLGAIYVENRTAKNVFDHNSLQPLTYFASQAAISIQNAMLYDELDDRVKARTAELAAANELLVKEIEERKRAQDELHEWATTDPLTKVLNRRHFFHLAKVELSRCRDEGCDLAVILMDIDYFKHVNDTHGHSAGDQVLREFSQRVKEVLREDDIFARFGGEEFVVLLPKNDMDAAQQMAERMRSAVKATPLTTKVASVPVTISLGVAHVVGGEELVSLDTLLDHADQALYQAKEEGRDRVVLWNGDES